MSLASSKIVLVLPSTVWEPCWAILAPALTVLATAENVLILSWAVWARLRPSWFRRDPVFGLGAVLGPS